MLEGQGGCSEYVIAPRGAACPLSARCAELSAPELDSLYAQFRSRSFGTMTQSNDMWPSHLGARLRIMLGGRTCEVEDFPTRPLKSVYSNDFWALVDAVRALVDRRRSP